MLDFNRHAASKNSTLNCSPERAFHGGYFREELERAETSLFGGGEYSGGKEEKRIEKEKRGEIGLKKKAITGNQRYAN